MLHEKLKDLRTECNWTLSDLQDQTGIPISTLQRMESDKERAEPRISLQDIKILAELYNVSLDYLSGITDNRQHRHIEVDKLRLTDQAIEVLSNGKLNNRLISELLSHPGFPQLLSSMEIYIDRKISPQIGAMNGLYKLAESTIREKFKTADKDEILMTLQEAIVDEDEFLRYRISERFNEVMKSLFGAHKKDIMTKENEGVLNEIKDGIETYFDNNDQPTKGKLTLLAKQLGLNISHLSEEQLKALMSALESSDLYKRSVGKRKAK
jgi:transcriptional regulator with XRE-family HTH domain